MPFQINFELSTPDLERFYQAMLRLRNYADGKTGSNHNKVNSPFSCI